MKGNKKQEEYGITLGGWKQFKKMIDRDPSLFPT